MANPKTVKLFLIDGSPSGRIKCSLSNWVGKVYLIPHAKVSSSADRPELEQTGIYMLLGEDTDSGRDRVYVGQANKRINDKGMCGRVMEHLAKEAMDWVNHAIMITTSDDSFGPTEISHLERTFYERIAEVGRAELANKNNPPASNVTEEKQAELSEFFSYVRIAVGSLGSRIFEPANNPDAVSSRESTEPSGQPKKHPLVLNASGANGEGRRTNEGFVVLKGARLRLAMTDSVPESARRNRVLYADLITDDGELLEDVSFDSPSAASNFLIGASTNGKTTWKNSDGRTLGEMEQAEFEEATRATP